MPMTCLLLDEFVGGAVIDAAIPAIYSALLLFGALLFSISLIALLLFVVVILVSTNYWAFVYRPASLAHSRRKRKLKLIAADRASIKFSATSSKANHNHKHRYQSEPMSAYCRRVFHIAKRSIQYGITVLSYRGKREKKLVAARSVWCGMNRPLLLYTSSPGDSRNPSSSTPSSSSSSSSSAPSTGYPLPTSSHIPFSPPPRPFSPISPTFSPSTFSPRPAKNVYPRQLKSPGLGTVPLCVRKMLIISTDTIIQEREKEKERKREKERIRKHGVKEGYKKVMEGDGGGRGIGRGGYRGEGMGVRVRGRGGIQIIRQFSSRRSLEDELVVTRTGLADSTRRLVAPRIMFYSRQALTLMRSQLSQHENIGKRKQTRILQMDSNEDSFPESEFTEEFSRILDVFYPDGMTLSNEAKEESCELFDIWKNEYFEWSQASGAIQSEVRMINFKLFEEWFSNDFVSAIHSNLSDRIMDNISRSPVLAVKVKNKDKDNGAVHCTTQSVSWYAPPPLSSPVAERGGGRRTSVREEEKVESIF